MRTERMATPARIGAAVLLAAAVGLVGCSKKAPREANECLEAALTALAKGDEAGVASRVVPGQKDTLASLPEWPFFQAVKSHTIDNEFDTNVTSDSAKIMATVYVDAQARKHTNLAFTMKKVEGQWRIDLVQTIADKKATDGPRAFREVYQFVPVSRPQTP